MNCVLSNPFYRIKVIESKLIKDRIASITDTQILMDLFISVFQKSFSHSSITKYDYPVSKCFIDIGSEDMMEFDWIRQLKDLFMLSNYQVSINAEYDANQRKDYREKNLFDVIIRKYIQFFPCCIIFDIIHENDNEDGRDSVFSTIGTSTKILVSSTQVKKHSMNNLNDYKEYLCPDRNKDDINNNKVDDCITFIIGNIEEQCEKKRDDSPTSPSIAYRIRSLLFCLWYHIVVSRSN